jgi:phosphohistidine swiveling domain-containing protein
MTPKLKYLFDKDKWLLGEHIPDCDVFFFQIPATCFNNDKSYAFIKNYKKFLGVYKGFILDFYVGERDSFEMAESVLKALLERPNFGRDLDKNIIFWSYKLIDLTKEISKLPLQDLSNQQLWKQYEENDKTHTKLYTYGWLPVAVDLFHNNFTNKLKSYLYSVTNSKEEAENVFVVLTTPWKKTILAQEQESYLDIYEKYKRFLKAKKIPESLKNEIKKHAEKWGHLGYIYAGNVEPFGERHYLKELMDLASTGVDGRKILANEAKRLKTARQKQQQLYKKLKISPLYQRLFGLAQDFALSKLVRRHAQLLNVYLLHKTLLSEIAKRLHLSRYQVQFMLKGEVQEALSKGKADKKLLSKRLKHCVFYSEKNFEKIYLGAMEKKLRGQITLKIHKNITEIQGQIAQPGFAKGVVKIIFRAKDVGKMNKGDILVSVATDPDIVPAMKKAGAIVTEQGGITSHAAIVSRELGIPCVIGTKIATSVLKDGDLVEVDANKGIVRKL